MLHMGILGGAGFSCFIWMEDYQGNFITALSPELPGKPGYTFPYNTTTFWIHVQAANLIYSSEKIRGGYNRNICFDLHGKTGYKWHLDEHDYDDCVKIRDGPEN
ncbi:hypothetical protein C1645_833512 [Glomus cerebriforme]|uniref:Uncharacterized protein n=1 Tax=Glomus cerebriforme TaxID=658196 RepID=A0A397SBG4_9GLOM|nr:hypothetical protein C1645_833512 [Glomus cerebriforme]